MISKEGKVILKILIVLQSFLFGVWISFHSFSKKEHVTKTPLKPYKIVKTYTPDGRVEVNYYYKTE